MSCNFALSFAFRSRSASSMVDKPMWPYIIVLHTVHSDHVWTCSQQDIAASWVVSRILQGMLDKLDFDFPVFRTCNQG